ncbi:hypothetical protein YC2023_094963 [Brassica napus]
MELLMSNQLQMIRRWMMDQGEEDTQDEKGALKSLRWCMTEEPKGFKLELSFDSNPYFKYTVLTKSYHNIVEGARAMLLVRELGDISETTMAGVLATAEETESLNTRVSSKLMLFGNFEVKNASSLLIELVVAAAEAVVVRDKSDCKKKKKARRLRKVEINDKAGGCVKD